MEQPVLLDGKKLAKLVHHDLRREIVEQKLTPSLAVVLVGDDPASHLYVNLKQQAARKVGIQFHTYLLPEDATETEVRECITWLNQDPDIDAILVQLPLPKNLDTDTIVHTIDPNKDADGFLPENISMLEQHKTDLRPAPAQAVIELVKLTGEPLADKQAVVVANHDIFYKPIRILLEQEGAHVTYIDPNDTEKLVLTTPEADILIAAVGRPNFITAELIKPGAIVIDVGTNKTNNHVVGDVNAEDARDIAGALTPVPGGVGPMTIACLLRNVVTLCKLHQ